MPSDESKGSQLDAIGSLAQRQLDNTLAGVGLAGIEPDRAVQPADAADFGVPGAGVTGDGLTELWGFEQMEGQQVMAGLRQLSEEVDTSGQRHAGGSRA